MKSCDIIGDIHGHADELNSLLEILGYQSASSTWRHPEGRKVVFLGDFIDRGPKIPEALATVRGMVEAGDALAILGNHEVNAMRYHTTGQDGGFLRPHSDKNFRQHRETLDQFPDRREWDNWIRWFSSLPLSLDLGGLRAVHACWDEQAIREMNEVGRLEGAALERYSKKGTSEHDTISRIVNGPEALLPEGAAHRTADETMRREIRVKWWIDLEGTTCREAIFPECSDVPDRPLARVPKTGYPEDSPPTFFGHYALQSPTPAPIRSNLACLDYGAGKGGFLCAYSWDGEAQIDPAKYRFVQMRTQSVLKLPLASIKIGANHNHQRT